MERRCRSRLTHSFACVCARRVERRRIDHIPEQLHGLRVRLYNIMHFVNSLHSYLMNKAAFCDWEGLLDRMKSCTTLAEVVAMHDAFVEDLRRSMLLSDVGSLPRLCAMLSVALPRPGEVLQAVNWNMFSTLVLLAPQSMRMARREIEALLDKALEFTALYRSYQHQVTRTIRAFVEVYPRSASSVLDLALPLPDDALTDLGSVSTSFSTGARRH